MITKKEVLMGRDLQFPQEYTEEVSKNIDKLLIGLNKFRELYGKPMTVTSGWRPAAINANTPNAAKKSNHMVGLATDFLDKDGALDKFATEDILEQCDLYREHEDDTPGWCHLQCVPPKSGKRVFRAK